VRAAIRALSRRTENDPLRCLAGAVDDLPDELSEKVERYLADAFVSKPFRPYRARRRGQTRVRG
jgi:hypothetical protein